MTPQQRFNSKITITPGCWLWNAYRNIDGYGRFWFGGEIQAAHRASYLMHVGPIADAMEVCHRCDNPRCVNPDHLYAGTHAQNMRDMSVRGRGSKVGRRGQENGMSKLSNEQILAIRSDRRKVGVIAAEYSIAHQHVSKIRLGQRGKVFASSAL